MDKTTLASEMLIDALIKKKDELHITCAQIAEQSGTPESTVTKVFNRTVKSPSLDTLIPIAQALDVSMDSIFVKTVDKAVEKTAAATSIPAKMLVSQEDKFLNLFIETHDKQINDLKEQISIKDRWIKALAAILIVCTLVFAFIAVYDITHPGAGLIRTAESGDTIE
jgi:transcriptional regulator with XRE-family HTH domain